MGTVDSDFERRVLFGSEWRIVDMGGRSKSVNRTRVAGIGANNPSAFFFSSAGVVESDSFNMCLLRERVERESP